MAGRFLAILPLLSAVLASQALPEMPTDMSMDSVDTVNMPAAPMLNENAPVADAFPTAETGEEAPSVEQVPAQQAPASTAPGVITVSQAQLVINAAISKAAEIKMPSNIAISDPYGHLVAFARMDGAMLASIDVAQKKAKTVAMFNGRYRSGDLYNATAPGGALYGIQATNNGLLFFGGGVPLKLAGNYVGALGVSGGTVEQDVQIANAAAAALK